MATLRNILIAASLVGLTFAEEQLEERWIPPPPVSMKTMEERRHMLWAHGLMLGICFGFLYPFGAALLYLLDFRGAWLVHAVWQTFAYVVTIVGGALGIYFARVYNDIGPQNKHGIIGLVVIICLFFQPWTGLWHHIIYKRTGKPTPWGTGHRWFGRLVVALGTINAGWGLHVARRHDWILAFSIPAGFFYLVWIGAVAWNNFGKKAKKGAASPSSGSSSDFETAQVVHLGARKGVV